MSEESRRFTDQEVALVLKQAAEIDETLGEGGDRGLSITDLTEIAREVGISTEAIERAVAGLDRPRVLRSSLSGAPLVRKAAHAVPGRLTDDGVARLIRVIDEQASSAGAVTEALGSVRWTSSDRFRSTSVSVTRTDEETSIAVVEKAPERLRRVFQFLPPVWAVMFATPSIGALQMSSGATAAAVGAALLAGAGIGRAAWNYMSSRSAARVRELAEAVAAEGQDAVRDGLVEPGPE